jgi:hypothetical protein
MNFRFFPQLGARCYQTLLWFVTGVSLFVV